ncbi:glycosyltransferase family 2 protein [Luteimonas sp. RD2P54]|uniref:Glycosyltransferase family 2 protein n=1 Tax=Luteimonas endophytica TaxID=3042023 RepID=A0ABT6J5W5_9GAMM|nr:glycosyltransferase family 2 protein [Luteimonas endophytica]MDH5821932.1 glycosyltransferase family 2 protein [Luteimonas endophytica]
MSEPVASIVFTTYNQPAWLEKTLLGFAAQDRRDFEVLVADDGSGADTAALIESLRSRLPFALRHVWHEDRGFRKSRILNAAIAASRADYLIFTDGDCIPRRDFVSMHLRLRRPGRYLSGGYLKLPMELSRRISGDDIASNRCFELAWLRAHGLPTAARNVKLLAQGASAALLDRIVTASPTWNGHNASGWKRDLVAANGFDERMGYGGQDRELGERLGNAGVRGIRVRHRAIALHLDHARGYRNGEALRRNFAIRARTRIAKATWTEHGIVKGPAHGGASPAGLALGEGGQRAT